MSNGLKTLALLLVAVLVFSVAGYLDNYYGRHTPVTQDTPLAAAEAEAVVPETQTDPEETVLETTLETEPPKTEPQEQKYLLTFAGDCALGSREEHFRAGYGFWLTVGEDYAFPLQNVKSYFEQDDLTIVNLEGVLTDEGYPVEKRFTFRGPEAYTNILTEGSVELVSLSNNHTHDYGERGYGATKAALEKAGISYVEEKQSKLITLDGGLTVGIFGTVYNSMNTEMITSGIQELKDQGADLIIYAPHWGTEYSYRTTVEQQKYSKVAVEAGAHIVYGCHPHVLQPIEEYMDSIIYYSLANFSFGGNIYPPDYDTALVQQEVIVDAQGNVTLGEHTIIPCSISSIKDRNNFQPTPYEEGSDAYNRVLSKLSGTHIGSIS